MKKNYVFVLTLGVFSILNTEMGIVGILPMVSDQYSVSLTDAGLLVSLFALAIAISGPILPMLFSRFERKKVMLLILFLFSVGNILSAFATSFTMLLVCRVLPAFLHPVYVSFAISAASDSVSDVKEAPKAVSKVMIGVSTGMVLGAPIAGVIGNAFNIQMGFIFFALMNILALVATILFVPTMEGKHQSYGEQLLILKEKKLWLALIGVLFLNGSIFGVYSYVSSYLDEVVSLGASFISGVLLIYGLMNIIGNTIAGRKLVTGPNRLMMTLPILIGLVYILLLGLGTQTIPAIIIVFIWGILAGIVANTIQYWVADAAPQAPEFANGLYLTAANLGVSLATPFCGLFITNMGMNMAPLGGLIIVVCSAICVLLKVKVIDKEVV